MLEFLRKHRLSLAIVVTLLGLLLVVFQDQKSLQDSILQQTVQTLVHPAQVLTHWVASEVEGGINTYLNLVETQAENQQLKQRIAALQQQLNQFREESIQYRRLKHQLAFAKQNPDKKVFAEIIGESADNIHQIRIINRGQKDGIHRNLAVLLKEGVVGHIQAVSPFQSVVQLITDRRSRVPALIQRNRVRGLAFGTHHSLELRQINRRAEIKEGDRVITSGLGRMYPKGVLLGTVVEVKHKSYELFKTAVLEPAINFDQIEEVFVIIRSHTQPQGPLFSDNQ
ncbi:MAG TPA: rod shape-determining protein MreC [Deltaproteobacteria bacterium]|nr:rod shape-determining protein MreC [Deltaproteobacteria bacterium]